VLFEGAQAVLLDIDHGTYPFVTSSNTVAGQAAAGAGVSPRAIGTVLGIVKSYTTRVGEGPFPTELRTPRARNWANAAMNSATVTGRKRRCGWFDAVLVRQNLHHRRGRRHRADETRCAGRVREDQYLHRLSVGRPDPRLSARRRNMQAAADPIYETLDGWTETTAGARSWASFPPTPSNMSNGWKN